MRKLLNKSPKPWAVWHRAPANTAPRVKLLGGWRRGRRSYYTTRAEIARYYPEIDDG